MSYVPGPTHLPVSVSNVEVVNEFLLCSDLSPVDGVALPSSQRSVLATVFFFAILNTKLQYYYTV